MSNDELNNKIHNIHSYIRNHTKISSEDKPLFIGGIVLALTDPIFCEVFTKKDTRNILDLLLNTIETSGLDKKRFMFLKTSLDKEHLYNLCKEVYNIVEKNNDDILNKFYTEFVKYQNSDSKTLGIVLTPHHIVRLMIDILDINSDDIVLDLCAGTGSFLCEAMKYKPNKVIGCEYQGKLHDLLKINMIIRQANAEIYHDNCFNREFKATKSIINPPYGISNDNEKELNFIIKQLHSLSLDGLSCAIIPIGCLTNNVKNNTLKKEILKLSKVIAIIKCRKDLFQGTASVDTCIVLLQRTDAGHNNKIDKVLQLDYKNDGMINIIRNGFQKMDEYETIYQNILYDIRNINEHKCVLISDNVDWTDFGYNVDRYINKYELELDELKAAFQARQKELLRLIEMNKTDDLVKYENEKEFKLGDIFEILKKPKDKYQHINQTVPLICASKENNGIKCFCESTENTFQGNMIVLVTGGDGAAGIAHYQKEPFMITSSTIVLKPKIHFLNEKNGPFIAKLLSKYKQKYSYAKQWNRDRIMNDTITLPIDLDGNISLESIENISQILSKSSCSKA